MPARSHLVLAGMGRGDSLLPGRTQIEKMRELLSGGKGRSHSSETGNPSPQDRSLAVPYCCFLWIWNLGISLPVWATAKAMGCCPAWP